MIDHPGDGVGLAVERREHERELLLRGAGGGREPGHGVPPLQAQRRRERQLAAARHEVLRGSDVTVHQRVVGVPGRRRAGVDQHVKQRDLRPGVGGDARPGHEPQRRVELILEARGRLLPGRGDDRPGDVGNVGGQPAVAFRIFRRRTTGDTDARRTRRGRRRPDRAAIAPAPRGARTQARDAPPAGAPAPGRRPHRRRTPRSGRAGRRTWAQWSSRTAGSSVSAGRTDYHAIRARVGAYWAPAAKRRAGSPAPFDRLGLLDSLLEEALL